MYMCMCGWTHRYIYTYTFGHILSCIYMYIHIYIRGVARLYIPIARALTHWCICDKRYTLQLRALHKTADYILSFTCFARAIRHRINASLQLSFGLSACAVVGEALTAPLNACTLFSYRKVNDSARGSTHMCICDRCL